MSRTFEPAVLVLADGEVFVKGSPDKKVGIGDKQRYERVDPSHSWNSNNIATNVLLYHLQRHSDHHAHPTRRYQALRHFDDSPQLPSGYGLMLGLAGDHQLVNAAVAMTPWYTMPGESSTVSTTGASSVFLSRRSSRGPPCNSDRELVRPVPSNPALPPVRSARYQPWTPTRVP